MIFFILNIILFSSLFFGKYLFRKWINPISVYAVIWYFMLSFYYLKLINYDDLSIQTWYVIFVSYSSFLLGVTLYFISTKSIVYKKKEILKSTEFNRLPCILQPNSNVLFLLTLFLGILGLLAALQAWSVLINMYGSVSKALLHLGALYQMRVKGELVGIIPYTSVFIFASIFFAGIHSAVKSRITFISLLPLSALIIKEIAIVGRASILFGFVEYGFTFLFTYIFISKSRIKSKKTRLKLFISIGIALTLFVGSITIIKNLRGGSESLSGKTRRMKVLDDSVFISPTIYLYLSGHVGVLDKYLEYNNEEGKFGENTFQFIYNSLSKFNLVERPYGYDKGYFIPVWINTGTFIRDLLSDFGIVGVMIFLYILGFIVSLSWENFFSGMNFFYLAILVFLMVILSFSFLMIITRLANWFLSLGLIIVILKLMFLNEEKKHRTI